MRANRGLRIKRRSPPTYLSAYANGLKGSCRRQSPSFDGSWMSSARELTLGTRHSMPWILFARQQTRRPPRLFDGYAGSDAEPSPEAIAGSETPGRLAPG